MTPSNKSEFSGSELEEITISRIQEAFRLGEMTSRKLVQLYKARIAEIDSSGPKLRSIIEVNPEAEEIAGALDEEYRTSGPRGPLHGIPIVIKDNIDTADQMQTTAGSLALLGSKPAQDAFLAAKLREAGAVILGKANMSEWANFRSNHSSSGWSGRGRQCRNPYILTHNPCGSSSGSGVAVSANLCVAALATETDGSIVCPANMNGVVGIKPTVGLTSRTGVIPISHSQDTIGPHARTVTDAAILLGALVGVDPRDEATAASAGKYYTDYTQFLDPNGLKGARIGVIRKVYTGNNSYADRGLEKTIQVLKAQGAIIVDPADIPTAEAIKASNDEMTVLTYEFKADLNAYLKTRVADPAANSAQLVSSLEDIIAFNKDHAEQEMPYFGQEILELSQARGDLTEEAYLTALENNRRLGGREGIDAVLKEHNLDALIAPTGSPAYPTDLLNGDHFTGGSSTPAAIAGYPLITVPADFVFGLPVGITFMGTAFSEPTLIKLAFAFEQATRVRQAPRFKPVFDLA